MFEQFNAGDLAAKPDELKKLLAENEAVIETLIAQENKSFTSFIRPIAELDEKLAIFTTPVCILQYTENSEQTQAAYSAMLPLLSDYETRLAQDTRILKAYRDILSNDNTIDATQRKLLGDAILAFVLEGAELDDGAKEQIAAINARLADIDNLFSQNLLEATKAYEKEIDQADLEGIAPSDLEAFKAEGGKWKLTLLPHAYISYMTYGQNRALREELYRAHTARAPQNEAIIEEMLKLKNEKARLLGMRHYADYSLKTKMAPSAEAAIDFITELIEKSAPQAKRELDELKAFAKANGFKDELQSYDFSLWSKKLEKAKFDLNEELYKPYFESNRALLGLFDFLTRLFGVSFQEAKAPVWNDRVLIYDLAFKSEVFGRLYVDLYERKSKRGGAWMDAYQTRMRRADDSLEFASAYICCNFPAPSENAPSLLRHSDVVTLFHEVGHAIHHLFSRVNERDLSGIGGVEWDAVEFPSQWLENFAYESRVLELFASHYQTGEKLPRAMIQKLIDAKNFQSALAMLRQCEFALFDLKVHLGAHSAGEVQAILDEIRKTTSLIKPPEYNKFQNGFSHIFGGGYSAGYYSYKWAEVLSADAYLAFAEKGVFDRALADRFLNSVLSVGGSRKAMDSFAEFMGRRPNADALLSLNKIEVKNENVSVNAAR
ncbi:MAG: M3 family metallopeptidase [Helicobacteraceae bacterium]|jgi:oligopeptidase A|nr:M3 family metallopeptidase [Helicobacteraceae bacterium]